MIQLFSDGECEVQLVEIRPSRPVTQRQSEGLRGVWQLDRDYSRQLEAAGIRTLQDLAMSRPEELAEVMGWSRIRKARFWVAHARSLLSGRHEVLENPCLPEGRRVYVDIETDRYGKYCWLVSAADEDGPVVQFFSDCGPAGERKVLSGFVEWLARFQGAAVLWYGSQEGWVLPARLKAHGLPVPAELDGAVDVFGECFARLRLALPIERFGLKEVAQWMGFPLRHPELSGWTAAYRYEERVARSEGRPERERQLRELLEYGEDDVLALRAFVQWVERACQRSQPTPSRSRSNLCGSGGRTRKRR
jgi:predicted RecB family nuclease